MNAPKNRNQMPIPALEEAVPSVDSADTSDSAPDWVGPNAMETRKGTLTFPAYIPTAAFGEQFHLNKLIMPYLPRLSNALMVNVRCVEEMAAERPLYAALGSLICLVDSGAYALLANKKNRWESKEGLHSIHIENGLQIELHPRTILEAQEQHADIAFTLDIPIPPGCPAEEAQKRLNASLENAIWMLDHRTRQDMPLFGSLPVYTLETTRNLAVAYERMGFDGMALGGLVPRQRETDFLIQVVQTVREVTDRPIHLFGMGQPETCRQLFQAGASMSDSSSYVRFALEGKMFGQKGRIEYPSQMEKLHLALINLALGRQATLPLSTFTLGFSSWLITPESFAQRATHTDNTTDETGE